jgi:hypothetical protein
MVSCFFNILYKFFCNIIYLNDDWWSPCSNPKLKVTAMVKCKNNGVRRPLHITKLLKTPEFQQLSYDL